MSADRPAAETLLAAILAARRDEGDAAIYEALDLLANTTGEARFRTASSVIRGAKVGRPKIVNDVAEVRALMGKGVSRPQAIASVARRGASENRSADSIARHLRRRVPKETDKKDLSAAPS